MTHPLTPTWEPHIVLQMLVASDDAAQPRGIMDSVDNDGKPYQSAHMAKLVEHARALVTAPTTIGERQAIAEGLADAVAGALASVSVAYTHVTLNDMSTAGRSWKVHEAIGGNPFDRNEWLGEFDNKADANALASTLRRERAIQAALAALPIHGEMREALERIDQFVTKFRQPWGSWKTVWWEGEVSDEAAFSADNALMHVANIARNALQGDGL